MHRKRFLPMAGLAALMMTTAAPDGWRAWALPSRGTVAATTEEFSPLFPSRLDAGVERMDGAPGRVQAAALSLEQDDLGAIASAQPISFCLGSACMRSYCLGSACIGSQCLGSGCSLSGCAGSLCAGSICLGSTCLGTGCLGSACTTCLDTGPSGADA